MEAPEDFFAESLSKGKPKNKYVGGLYFRCHRGTHTNRADMKLGNRRSELALREAEIWAVAASDQVEYLLDKLDAQWKAVLLNQFHDILGDRFLRILDVYESVPFR